MQVRKAIERRRFAIQAVFSLLTNSYVVGFLTGTLYKGPLKQICVPGMNCYSEHVLSARCRPFSISLTFQKASGRTATAIWSRNRFTILRFTLSAFLCSSAHFAEGSFAVFFARSD